MPYLVVINRPYYPSMDKFETEEEANVAFQKAIDDVFQEGGFHEAAIYVAKVTQVAGGRSDY